MKSHHSLIYIYKVYFENKWHNLVWLSKAWMETGLSESHLQICVDQQKEPWAESQET